MENKTKIQIWSKDGRKMYLCKEFDNTKEASEYMSNFIYAEVIGAEYVVKIKKG